MERVNIARTMKADLMARPTAREFYDRLAEMGDAEFVIDFEGVNFVSRSFMDEFYNLFLKPQERPFTVTLDNLSEDAAALLDAVKATQNKKKYMTEATVYKAKSLKDMERFFNAVGI